MKLISTTCFILATLVATLALTHLKLLPEGTSVIYVPSARAGERLAVKLPDELSAKQHDRLNFAYAVASEDGYKNPRYLQGILMQESHACDVSNYRVAGLTNKVGDRYFGCGQIKLDAAKDVMRAFPTMWKYLDTRTDEELQARLILDDEFNIRVASKYALLMGINDNPGVAITRYNLGEGGAATVDPRKHEYTLGVKRHIEKLNVPSQPRRLQSQISTSTSAGRSLVANR